MLTEDGHVAGGEVDTLHLVVYTSYEGFIVVGAKANVEHRRSVRIGLHQVCCTIIAVCDNLIEIDVLVP